MKTIFFNCTAFSMRREGESFSNILVESGKILDFDITEIQPDWQSVDCQGGFLFPGLIDAHTHLYETGLLKLGVDLGNIENIEEGLANLASKKDVDIIRGHSFDPDLIPEKRYFSIDELNAISSKPIFIRRRDGHSCVMNQAAFDMMKWQNKTNGIETDSQGKPTGVVRAEAHEAAAAYFNNLVPLSEKQQAYYDVCQNSLAKGITAIYALVGDQGCGLTNFDVLTNIQESLPLRVEAYPQVMNVKAAQERGLSRIGGCLLIDGSFGSKTAALIQPYTNTNTQGCLYLSDEELQKFVLEAHEAGLQISMHAIGDRAIEQLLNAYIYAVETCPRKDHRHLINHFILATDEHIEKTAQYGFIPSMQPSFELFWGGVSGMYARNLGIDRVMQTNRFRTILDAGIPIAGGSDAYVTPLDSRIGLQGAVHHPNLAQQVSVYEAFKMFTYDAAFSAFKEKEFGCLQKQASADFVIFGKNPFENAEHLDTLPVTMTVVKGHTHKF